MKPPKSVKVGPFHYTVAVGGSAWDAARLSENDADLVGHHAAKTLVISAHPDLVHDALCEVLVHELLHACFNVTGQPVSHDDEEDAVRSLAPALLGVLRDNPDLVAFLTS